MQYNQVNITIDLEQEFHVAYVWIQMANSPKPSTWVLERSADYGETWQPWFYFAENEAECMRVSFQGFIGFFERIRRNATENDIFL